MIPWHRLLCATMADFLKDTCFAIETEVDLSMKAQLLDLLLIRRKQGPYPKCLPDGFDELAVFNLITYKSLNEPLGDYAIYELLGHYINCHKINTTREKVVVKGQRKVVKKLRDPSDFRLYALSTARPNGIHECGPLLEKQMGVYDILKGRIRVIVLSEIPTTPENALWNLFSAQPEKVKTAVEVLDLRGSNKSSIFNKLLEKYNLEGISMPYTIEDFNREVRQEYFDNLTPDESLRILKNCTPQDLQTILKAALAENRLRELFFEQIGVQLTEEQLNLLRKKFEVKD